ncbi:MAG TPA: hypothetical protein VHC97_14745 [Thermoanaerobaculia bacterium]|jgi:hypothetical protein|nr:hypothetical protein [Thermoanaerobaculia bacterium]
MPLPRLKDYLPAELDFPGPAAPRIPDSSLAREAEDALGAQEAALLKMERTTSGLKQAVDRFMERIEDRWTELDEEEVIAIIQDFLQEEVRNRAPLLNALSGAESRRKDALKLRDTTLKARLLALTDREIKALRAASDAFELGKRRLLKIRDHVLTRDAQEMSTPFWNGDEPDS